jgi:hypothetical protein
MAETTVKVLIEQLKSFNQDMPITNELNEPFVHIVSRSDGSTILSTQKPIAVCNRTGGYIYPTTTPDYFGYSPDVDEDVYEIETSPIEKEDDE